MDDSLAPDAAALLALLREGPQLSLRDMSVRDARAAVRQMGEAFDSAPDASVGASEGLCPAGHRQIRVRCYTPADIQGDGPVILFAHGGGWVTGDLDSYDSFCRFLAARSGLRVANVDYRRAPEAIYPAALEDMLAAARWISAGFSPLGVVAGLIPAGDSAGGGLAAAIAMRGAADGLDLRGVLLFYPVLDLTQRAPSYRAFAEGYLLSASDMEYFIDSYVPDIDQRTESGCSPLLGAAYAEMPPVALLTCSHDVLRDEGHAFASACHAAGIVIKHIEATGHVHGIATLRKIVPSGVSYLDETISALRMIRN